MTTREKQIQELDLQLSILREGWVDSPKDKKPKWMEKINNALDERLELMKLRDKATASF